MGETVVQAATTAASDVKADVAVVESQWAFVKANWKQVSVIVIASAVVGLIVGHIL